jgi:hypothetical protein
MVIVASAPGAIIGPAAVVSELASASPATRSAVSFSLSFLLFEGWAFEGTLRNMSG